ncbi:serine hydrolase [Ramlibacter sp.]|uniref:serine hydrolase n=1 Tax=Ramlibacter sp. TaxID=1917967 RepID=UPI00263724B1|nr:serine hydrolase [Ramlibacter sp.]MDB5956924.1 putative beta-lactamase [Ramlibacter sp.]
MAFATIRILLAAAALLTVGAAAAAAACPPPAPLADGWRIAEDPAAAGFNAERLCTILQSFAASPANLHGLVIERAGSLVAEEYREGQDAKSFALFTRRTAFDAGTLHDLRSITKSVLGLLWGIAQRDGAVPPLAAPVLGQFPQLAALNNGGRERITIEDALAMRSGLDWDESGSYRSWSNDEQGLLWRSDQARYVFDRAMAAPAGTRFNYNAGLPAVLALLLARNTGVPVPEYARLRLFQPLGITDWEWVRDLQGRPLAYSGLRLRPRDLAKIGRMVLDGGRWNGRQVVPAPWIAASLAPHVPSGEYGYLWWRGVVRAGERNYEWRAGIGNGGQRLFLVPALDLVVVTTAGQYNDRGIGRELLALLSQVVGAVQGSSPPPLAPRPEAALAPSSAVFTRATVQSVSEQDPDGRIYIRLKLQAIAQYPFSTLTYRVRDRRLLEGLQPGATVDFRAEPREGENTLVELHPLAP